MEASQQIPSRPVLLGHWRTTWNLSSTFGAATCCVFLYFFFFFKSDEQRWFRFLQPHSRFRREDRDWVLREHRKFPNAVVSVTGSGSRMWTCARVWSCHFVSVTVLVSSSTLFRTFPLKISFVLFLWFHISVASIFAPAPWLRKFLHLKCICCSVLNVCIHTCFRFFVLTLTSPCLVKAIVWLRVYSWIPVFSCAWKWSALSN